MKALLFGVAPQTPLDEVPTDLPEPVRMLAATPMAMRELPDPVLKADDWCIIRPHLTGICGSDIKQVLADGEMDNAMTAVISFPQVLGHEMVGTVVESGPTAGHRVGDRVVFNPWLSCETRGIYDLCPSCQQGDYSMCWSFTEGHLAPGIHAGNSSDATGGFAELVPAHRIMAIPCPEEVPDEVAVLADPFSVSLHSVLRNPPPPGGKALVYGVGALGLTTCAILQALYPDVEVGAVARFDHQAAMAEKHGARSFAHEPRQDLVEQIAQWCEAPLRKPFIGLSWTYPGGVDVIYDTVVTGETLEVGVRVAKPRGRLVLTGVSKPARFEWTPWYFKELTLVGANAFGHEDLDGRRQHAIAHYLDLARTGRIDVSHMLTHTFAFDAWRDAFGVLARQGESGALKVAFDFR
jgi:threonine dehydrogenase-like Zn-dependent dehydrogenase